MSDDRLDHLSRQIAVASGRRAVLGALAAVPLAGAASLIGVDSADAKKKHKDKKKKKKHVKRKTFCLNGVKYKVKADKKGKINRLKKKGATPGKCTAPAPVTTTSAPSCQSIWSYAASFGDPGTNPGDLINVQDATFTPDARTLLITTPTRVTAFTRTNASSVKWNYAYFFGATGTSDGQFLNAADLTLSVDGLTAYVADSANQRISIWKRQSASSPAWAYSSKLTGVDATTPVPNPIAWGVAISQDELTALIAEGPNNFISVWTRPSNSSTSWTRDSTFGTTGGGTGQLLNPTGVVLSKNTLHAWVADSDNDRISAWTRATTSSPWQFDYSFGSTGGGVSQFNSPHNLTISENELIIWVSDTNNNRVSIWSRTSTANSNWVNKTTFGSSGPQFTNLPLGLGITPSGGTVAVAASYNDKISVWNGNVCIG
ncbi:MAG: NHL repeat-containing protein [Thermomicrobiales bacterium]